MTVCLLLRMDNQHNLCENQPPPAKEAHVQDRIERLSADGSHSKQTNTESKCDTTESTMPSGMRTPPPSLVSPDGATMRSECVPVPSQTDAIARVSRQLLAEVKAEEESEFEFASGEDWDDDRKSMGSQYSTADEDETVDKRKERHVKRKKRADMIKSAGDDCTNSSDIDVGEDQATSKLNQCVVSMGLVMMTENVEALKPVIVRQVSCEEEVRILSEDDDTEIRLEQNRESSPMSPLGEDVSKCKMTSIQFKVEDIKQEPAESDEALSKEHSRCESTDSVEVGRRKLCRSEWLEFESTDKNSTTVLRGAPLVAGDEHEDCVQDKLHPYGKAYLPFGLESVSSETSFKHVTRSHDICDNRSSRQSQSCEQSQTARQLQAPDHRFRQAMVEALTICEQELGPLAATLATIQEKVRKLNIIELANRRPVTPSLRSTTSSSIQKTSGSFRPPVTVCSSLIQAPPITTHFHPPSPYASALHRSIDVSSRRSNESICRYCGLQEAAMSPVARMYILLAQPLARPDSRLRNEKPS